MLKGEGFVYSGDLKGALGVVYDKIPITSLGEEGEMQIVAFAKTGKGSEHSKFSPGLMFYRHVVEIKMDGDLYERMKEQLPNNEIKKEGKSIIILDNQKKEVSDICEEICREEGKKLEMIPKNELIITVESFGQIDVNEIFQKSYICIGKRFGICFQKNLILYIFKRFLILITYKFILCRDSEVVKRAGLKIPSLSEFGGSNPLPCITYAPVAQPGLEHLRPKERVVGSNPIGRIRYSNL